MISSQVKRGGSQCFSAEEGDLSYYNPSPTVPLFVLFSTVLLKCQGRGHSVILKRKRRPLIFKNFVSNDSLHFHPLLALLPSYLHREEELAWRVSSLLLLRDPPLFLLLRPMQVLILLMKTTHRLLRMLPAIFTSSTSFSRRLCPSPPLFFPFFFALYLLTSVSSALVFW